MCGKDRLFNLGLGSFQGSADGWKFASSVTEPYPNRTMNAKEKLVNEEKNRRGCWNADSLGDQAGVFPIFIGMVPHSGHLVGEARRS